MQLSFLNKSKKKKTPNTNFSRIVCDFPLPNSQNCVFDGLRGVGSVKKDEDLLVFGGNGLKWGKKMRKNEKRILGLSAEKFILAQKLSVVSADKLGLFWRYDTETDNYEIICSYRPIFSTIMFILCVHTLLWILFFF